MIHLDYRDPRPIYEQVAERITELVLTGVLPAHEKLPSVRQLAMELSINPNTIQRSYQLLEQSGVIYSQQGRGSFISEDFDAIRQEKRRELLSELERLAREALRLGISQKELTEQISHIYTGGAAQ